MSELSEYVARYTIDTGMSVTKFAQLANIGFETARSLLNGSRVPRDETLESIAKSFPEMSLSRLRELSGRPLPEREFRVPPEVHQLSEKKQRALEQILRILTHALLLDDVDEGVESNGTVTPIRDARVTRAAHLAPMGDGEH